MSGGTIPASRYSSSTLTGLKHPVIDLHASFSSGSSLEACGDQDQTGHTYSAAVYDSANAVVLIVLALQPHLEFDNLFRRLFRVATVIVVCDFCSSEFCPGRHLGTSDGVYSPGLHYSI